MAVVVSNQARFGALFSVSPAAVNTDGFFDLCVIADPASRFRELGIVLRAVLGKEMFGPGITHSRLHRARILTDRMVPFFGDGEILSRNRDFRIKILPRTLRLIVPEKAAMEEFNSSVYRQKCFIPVLGKPDKSVRFIENNTASNPDPCGS